MSFDDSNTTQKQDNTMQQAHNIYLTKLSERGSDLFLFADLFSRHANEELNRNVV